MRNPLKHLLVRVNIYLMAYNFIIFTIILNSLKYANFIISFNFIND